MTTKKTPTPTSTVTSPPASPSPAASPPVTAITATTQTTTHTTKVDLQTAYQSLASGLVALYLPTDVFQMKSGTFTRDELVAQFQKYIAAAETTKAANQAWRNDVQLEREAELVVRPLRQGVRGIATARFGKDGAQLLQLGFAPTKPSKKTVAVKAVAVARAKATRKARGTKGSKQKLAIKGAPTPAPVPAPAPAPVPPVPEPAPAPAPATPAPVVTHPATSAQ